MTFITIGLALRLMRAHSFSSLLTKRAKCGYLATSHLNVIGPYSDSQLKSCQLKDEKTSHEKWQKEVPFIISSTI